MSTAKADVCSDFLVSRPGDIIFKHIAMCSKGIQFLGPVVGIKIEQYYEVFQYNS